MAAGGVACRPRLGGDGARRAHGAGGDGVGASGGGVGGLPLPDRLAKDQGAVLEARGHRQGCPMGRRRSPRRRGGGAVEQEVAHPWRSSAFLFSRAIRASMPPLRRVETKSERRVASSLIVPAR